MKVKLIAAAVASFAALAAQAAPLASNTTPAYVIYVSGASAQKQALENSVANVVCDTPADARWFKETTSGNSSEGMLCKAKTTFSGAASGTNLLVVYSSQNGSAAGVNQVLSAAAIPTETESNVLTLPCGNLAGGATAGAATVLTCLANTESKLALSDVLPYELVPGAVDETKGRTLADLNGVITALQGFGVIAGLSGTYDSATDTFNSTDNMYRKLQEQNVAEGLLLSACTTGAYATVTNASRACQPSIKKSEYASLVSVEGGIKSPARLLPNVTIPAGTKVVVQRRVFTSGTQASSNLYFLNNRCSIDASLAGALNPKATTSTAAYKVVENPQTGDVRNNVAAGVAGEWTIGVVSLDNADNSGTSTKWRFVKLDGVSPNVKTDGTTDAKNRVALQNGRYGFAFEMSAMTPTDLDSDRQEVADAIVVGLTDSTASDLTGIAYLDGAVAAKQARLRRNGNNCSPLN